MAAWLFQTSESINFLHVNFFHGGWMLVGALMLWNQLAGTQMRNAG